MTHTSSTPLYNTIAMGTLKGNRYELLQKIGEGGMGVVYRAADRLTGSFVALKQITKSADMIDFGAVGTFNPAKMSLQTVLANEFKILSSLRHPNIISVLDYGFDVDQQPFFTMDLLETHVKISVAALKQPESFKVHVLIQLLQALAYLHQHGIIHRDLKPGNVLCTAEGQVKVLDFGLALSAGVAHQGSEIVSGTLAYIAPEIFKGGASTIASDIYAFGMIAYEVFTGIFPFEALTIMETIDHILYQTLDYSMFSPELAHMLARLLAKDPTDRFQTVNAVIASLSEALHYTQPIETLAIRESYLQAASFVGRQAELATLQKVMTAIVQSHGATWLVAGESGTGKSRLLAEMRVQALVEDVLVLHGQAIAEGGTAYRVWQDVLQWLSVLVPLSDNEAGALKPIIWQLETLLKRSVPDLSDLAGTASGERLTSVVIDLLQRVGKPLIILLEDLQWAGDESLTLLDKLSQRVDSLPVLLLGSYRDDETPQLHSKIPRAQTIRLKRFNHDQIAQLSGSMLGAVGFEPRIVNFLEQETEGNVFFIVETLHVLAEEAGGLQNIASKPLPESIVVGGMIAALRSRLARAPQHGRPLLDLAAVIGRDLDLNLLRYLAPDVALEPWLNAYANIAVLDPEENRWRFAHDKLREQVVQDIRQQSGRLQMLHAQVAQAIESVYPDAPAQYAALAYHWTQAGVAEKAVHYNEQAAQQIVQNASFQAIQYINTAMSFDNVLPLISNERRALRYSIVGMTYFAMGKMDEAIVNLEHGVHAMGMRPPPTSRLGIVAGTVREIGIQTLHRLWPKRYLARQSSGWLQEQMFYALLTLPIVYQSRGQIGKMLYTILAVLNRIETLKPGTVASPVVSYTWLHLALGMVSLRGISNYYRRLALRLIERDQFEHKINPIHTVGAKAQMAAYDFMIAQWGDAVASFTEVETRAASLGDLHSTDLAQFCLGLTYQQMGDFRRTPEKLLTGYNHSKTRGDREMQFMFLTGYGAFLVRTHQLTAAGFDDLSLFRDSAAAAALFADQFKAVPLNEALYKALQAALYIAEGNTEFSIALDTAHQISRQAPLNPNLSFFDLYEVLARISSTQLRQMGTAAATVEHAHLLQILSDAAKKLRSYGRLYAYARPAAAVYQGWSALFQNRPSQAKAAWEKAIAQATTLRIPYYGGLAQDALAQLTNLSSAEQNQHRQAAQRLFAELGLQPQTGFEPIISA